MSETNYAVAPGEILSEWAEEHRITPESLACELELSGPELQQLLQGHTELTVDLSVRLSRTTGIPARHWLNLEHRYRLDLARLGLHPPRSVL